MIEIYDNCSLNKTQQIDEAKKHIQKLTETEGLCALVGEQQLTRGDTWRLAVSLEENKETSSSSSYGCDTGHSLVYHVSGAVCACVPFGIQR